MKTMKPNSFSPSARPDTANNLGRRFFYGGFDIEVSDNGDDGETVTYSLIGADGEHSFTDKCTNSVYNNFPIYGIESEDSELRRDCCFYYYNKVRAHARRNRIA